MEQINKFLSGAIVPFFLLLGAVFFLIKLRGRPLVAPKLMLEGMFKKKVAGGTSPIRAVIFALAGTLGVGNIVGVASAIALGGAGAVFWMWVSASLAAILKYGEVVLGVLHRRKRNGENFGGAMYYMKDFFFSCKKYTLGTIFSFAFVVLCLVNGFTMGCIIQSNAISQSLKATFEMDNIVVGAGLAILAVFVFFFNGKRIFALCEKLVPFVSALYIIMSLAVIIKSYEYLPTVFLEIFEGAFSFESAVAGGVGFLISAALRYGTIRGLFSNEAGCGTSPIAHATSNTDSACEQGFLGIFEVFIDTIVVCTMTALVILLHKGAAFEYSTNPIMMVLAAFSAVLGDASKILFSFSVFLFAFATIICWGYYGKECIYFISRNKALEKLYYSFYIVCIFVGSFISLDFVWEVADFAVGAMTVMNLFVLCCMHKEIQKETDIYFKKRASRRKL